MTRNAAAAVAEAEEKARLEALTLGARREERGIRFFAPMALPVPVALQTTTPRPDPEIVSRKKRGFGSTLVRGTMMVQPFVPIITEALKGTPTTTPQPSLQAAPLHQFQPYNYHQNPYALVNGQSTFANMGNEE